MDTSELEGYAIIQKALKGIGGLYQDICRGDSKKYSSTACSLKVKPKEYASRRT